MCFKNNMHNLNAYRNRKRSVTVWKKASLDSKTGLAITHYNIYEKKPIEVVVWWKKGTTVYPHKILEPFTCNRTAGAGLYFYTSRTNDALSHFFFGQLLIKATVKPQDIIAVNCDSSVICCVAAKVLDAPDPDPMEMRLKFLSQRIRYARNELKEHNEQIKEHNEQIEVWDRGKKEALQQMLDEVKKLEEKSSA